MQLRSERRPRSSSTIHSGTSTCCCSAPAAASGANTVADRFLQPGATIRENDTSTAPSVEDTFGALSLVLNGGGLNQLQVIIHELNNTFNGNQPQIRSFLETIQRGVKTIAGGRAAIDAALASIGNLSQKLNAGRGTIATGIATIAPAVGVLASENTQISTLLKELSNLGATGTRIADQSGQNSVNDAKDLLPVVQQLESVSQQLGPDLSELAAVRGRDSQGGAGALPAGQCHRQRAAARRSSWPRPQRQLLPTRCSHRHDSTVPGLPGPAPSPRSSNQACCDGLRDGAGPSPGEMRPVNRRLLPRMVALVLVIVLGVYYIVFDVLKFSVTSQPFSITVVMPSAGGLYTGADVTYRGVQVGTVNALNLSRTAVSAKLSINAGEHIPDNGVVRVKELSALGEQYIDLQPSSTSGPDLKSGSVIPAAPGGASDADRRGARRPRPPAQEHQPDEPPHSGGLPGVGVHRDRSGSSLDRRQRAATLRRPCGCSAGDRQSRRRRTDRTCGHSRRQTATWRRSLRAWRH